MSTGVAMVNAAAGPTRAAPGCVSMAGRGPATCGTPMKTRSWDNPCVGTVTTTPRTRCGSGGHLTCGVGSRSRLRRLVAKTLGVPATGLAEVATVQYAKVAEFQRRGLVHFHALIRLDGPRTSEGFAPAPGLVSATVLANLVSQAAASVQVTVPGVDRDDPARILVFGTQFDARPVRSQRRTDDPGQMLSPEQVAGYLAKYATKSVQDTDAVDTTHQRRLRATVRTMSDRATAHRLQSGEEAYALLGKWVHMLGFRGHFASKSRRYSITLGALRRARRRAQILIAQHQAEGRPLDLSALEADLLADDADETTLVIGHWHFVGTGWANEAQTVLANAAAARAREYDQWRVERRQTQRTTGERTT